MSVTIYGASDDLIEVEGDICEEFNPSNSYDSRGETGGFLAFSDGTLLRVEYTRGGIWRVTTEKRGVSKLTKVEAEGCDSDNYSDRVTLDGDIQWALYGESKAVRK